jgi:hypothetical protein
MAFHTVGGETGLHVIGILGTGIIVLMTTDAIVAHTVEPQGIFGSMAFYTGKIVMGTDQRKAVFFMNFGEVIDQPRFRTVAANAIIAHRLAVYIGMAGCAVLGNPIVEDQGGMAKFAIGLGMGTLQGIICLVVIELQGAIVYGPSGRIVAFHAIHPQLASMGRLGHYWDNGQKHDQYR